MRNLTGKHDLPDFFEEVRRAPAPVLLLDFDGTLAPFQPDPAAVVPYEGVPDLLDELLVGSRTRLVLVTGRSIDSILPLLHLRKRPEIWGSHGLERLHPDDSYELANISESATRALGQAQAWVEQEGLSHKSEQKPGCLALNFRGLDPGVIQQVRPRAVAKFGGIAECSGLTLHNYDGGIELRVPAGNKGDAVRTVRSETGEGSVIAYLGDDLTDEDGFRALAQEDLGVLVRPELRPTAADIWLRPPEELLAFLKDWSRAAAAGSRQKAAGSGQKAGGRRRA